ncbi:MAG: hypothetical protein HOO90_12075 [Methylotenera sp.]|uniref:hypothetical protein n=1 Tax=Methylotenera sp. TaxID=2051956 RepID=UPI0017E6F917|nr:hypothetical protein [Methylotenera sp.]NOU26252.1 hypothetical protein [Methylotenera sp.]
MDGNLLNSAKAVLQPYYGCDADFANALMEFKDALKLSHNIKTRSLWNLVGRQLDKPLEVVISLEKNELVKKLLLGFKLSTIGHTKPRYRFNIKQSAARDFSQGSPTITADLVDTKIKAKVLSVDTDTHTILKNMELWYQNVRFAIRSAKCANTLETTLVIIDTLKKFVPTREMHKNYESLQSYVKIKGNASKYCKFCWRLSLCATDYLEARETDTKHDFRLNDQYCNYHNPSDSTSKYKTDLPYLKIFQHELIARNPLRLKSSNFAFQFELDDFSKGYEMDTRKAVYDLVHTKLRLTRGKENPPISLPEQVYLLFVREKLSFDEIKDKLEKRMYSIKRAWGKLESLRNTHQREKNVCVSTGEVIDMLPDEALLIKTVNSLLLKNLSPVKIALKIGLFVHTVHAIKIRIENIEQSILKIDELKKEFKPKPNFEIIISKLDEIIDQLQQYKHTAMNIKLISQIKRVFKEKKTLPESFISKFIQPLN